MASDPHQVKKLTDSSEPEWSDFGKVPKPVLIGAISAAVWWSSNSYGPWYNSHLFQYLGIFVSPFTLFWGVALVLYLQEHSMLWHKKEENDPTRDEPTVKENSDITVKSNCIAFVMAISMWASQFFSRIVYARSMHDNDKLETLKQQKKDLEHLQESMKEADDLEDIQDIQEEIDDIQAEMGDTGFMKDWPGPEVAGDPLLFHAGMVGVSAIFFAFFFYWFFLWTKKYMHQDPHPSDKYWAAGIGLMIGAGLYIAHLVPAMNDDLDWCLPDGIATFLAGLLNGLVVYGALSLRPSLVGGEGAVPEKTAPPVKFSPPLASSPPLTSSPPNGPTNGSENDVESISSRSS